MVICIGVSQGIGNWLQCLPAIQCLKDKGFKVHATPTGSWPDVWRVLDGIVDGYVSATDERITHFIRTIWYSGPHNKGAQEYYSPYRPINQIYLHWELANTFANTFQKPLNFPKPPKLAIKPTGIGKPTFLAVHPAKTLSKHWDYKIYKHWKDLIVYLSKYHQVAVVGTPNDRLNKLITDYEINKILDYRFHFQTPLQHAQFLRDNCYGLITSASGWAFLGPASGVHTLVLWGPDSLKRNRPLGDNVHILHHGDCQGCYKIDHQPTGVPKCEKENQCMEFKPEEILNAVEKMLSVRERQTATP